MDELALAQAIDQTNLDPFATDEAFKLFCEEALVYQFAAVATLPAFVSLAAAVVQGSPTRVAAAISYPVGTVSAVMKAAEAADAVRLGADEIDYVMNVSALKSGEYGLLVDEGRRIVSAVGGRVVKVIIEAWCLSPEEMRVACEIGCEAGVTFVKSSTAYKQFAGMRPATCEDARLMLDSVASRCKVKIAGGIKDARLALALLDLGVARLGTSSGVAIIQGFRQGRAS